MSIIDGLPISEIAVDNLRLFPPEYCFTGRSAHNVRPSRFNKHSVTCKKNSHFVSTTQFRYVHINPFNPIV